MMTSFLRSKYNYILMHKDVPVQQLNIRDGNLLGSSEVLDSKHFPLGYSDVNSWWNTRAVPLHREGGTNPDRLKAMEKSLALSLSDCYWIKPKGLKMEWHEINYYNNPFKSMYYNSLELDRNPDTTSGGYLKKSWEWSGRPTLVKYYSTSNGLSQNKREVIITKLYKSLISSGFVCYTDRPEGAVCDCFCNSNAELVTADQMGIITYSDFARVINNDPLFDLMLAIDFITFQEDRHRNNFGGLRNPDTLIIETFVPIFDSGKCLFTGQLSCLTENPSKPFDADALVQFRLVNLQHISHLLKKLDIQYLFALIDQYVPEQIAVPTIKEFVRRRYQYVMSQI